MEGDGQFGKTAFSRLPTDNIDSKSQLLHSHSSTSGPDPPPSAKSPQSTKLRHNQKPGEEGEEEDPEPCYSMDRGTVPRTPYPSIQSSEELNKCLPTVNNPIESLHLSPLHNEGEIQKLISYANGSPQQMRTQHFSSPPRSQEEGRGQAAKSRDFSLGKPVCMELRPRPLKEMATNECTRVMACTNEAIWAACDYGIMVWNVESAFTSSCDGRDNIIGDEDAAAFTLLSVHGSITTSLVPDIANGIIWSGHRDGTVRAWPMHVRQGSARFEEIKSPLLIWQAHRAPLLAMVITSYGELWTGSENGSIRAWPLEATMSALSSTPDEPETVTFHMSNSYVDLRSRGLASGASTLSNTDVQFLIAEHSTCRVWSGGQYTLALWSAQTRDILKVFGTDAHADFSTPDASLLCEKILDDETKVKSVKVIKKEKSQAGLSFLQRSRNAVLGAADAVLRATVGGPILDESKKVEALVAAANGTVWMGLASGLLVKWDSNGTRLNEQEYYSMAVRCMCTFGSRVWVGYANGSVQVLDLMTGELLGSWQAHQSAVAQMKAGGGHVFTLADDGGIRGWNFASPSQLDDILCRELCANEASYTRHKQLMILAGSWNVGQERASFESMKLWLHDKALKASIVVIGLQEMEMGAGILALAAAKETVGLEGSANGQWWLENIGNALGGGKAFERVASRQLAGLLVGAWAKKNIVPYVGEVDVGAVACGYGRAFGNKGAVAIKMMVFRRTICVVNCHFAAHVDAVARRNADFEHVYNRMAFGRSLGGVGVAASAMAAGVSSAIRIIRGSNIRKSTDVPDTYLDKDLSDNDMSIEMVGDAAIPELSEAHMLIWVGDFNYRIDEVSYEDAVTLISHKLWDALLNKDQLRTEMKKGTVFQGMREGQITFPPTYKFDKGSNLDLAPAGYDSSEKKRVPAWCDRILFRDSFDSNDSEQQVSLSQPISAAPVWYEACMDVMESDHKPVSCIFNTELAIIDEAARRQEYGKLMHSIDVQHYLTEINYIPETVVNTNYLCLEDCSASYLKLTNECGQSWAYFDIYCEGQPTTNIISCDESNVLFKHRWLRGSYGFPFWLQVVPAAGVLSPHRTVEIALRHAKKPLMEDDDKAAIIVINVKGELSSISWQHRICVAYKSSCKIDERQDLIEHGERKFLGRSEGLVSELSPRETSDAD